MVTTNSHTVTIDSHTSATTVGKPESNKRTLSRSVTVVFKQWGAREYAASEHNLCNMDCWVVDRDTDHFLLQLVSNEPYQTKYNIAATNQYREREEGIRLGLRSQAATN